MRDYELMIIIRPELDEEALQATLARIGDLVTRAGGQIIRTTTWGRRKLAYPLKSVRQIGYRAREGYYIIFDLNLPARATAGLDHDLRLSEDILRFLMLIHENGAAPAVPIEPPPPVEDDTFAGETLDETSAQDLAGVTDVADDYIGTEATEAGETDTIEPGEL